MRIKGATNLDKHLHGLMDFYEDLNEKQIYGITRVNDYIASYHEDCLYSVFNKREQNITLVYAESPYKAIEKVMGYRNVEQVRTIQIYDTRKGNNARTL